MSKHLTPSDVIERIIGRPEVIGATIGADPKLAYSWRKGSKNRDPGDIPSARHMRALLAHAAARNLPLVAEDLIWGVDEDMLAARLANENFPAAASAVSALPEDCGGGDGAPAALSFRSCVGRRGTAGDMQAAPATLAGEEAPRPAPFAAGGRHG